MQEFHADISCGEGATNYNPWSAICLFETGNYVNIQETDGAFGRNRAQRLTTLLLLVVLLSACSSTLSRYKATAQRHQWMESHIATRWFVHRAWFSSPTHDRDVLHIYIEGDGRAWRTAREPSRDPTPVDGLMFRLMAMDDAPALYLGRPCYFATSDQRCGVLWWTFRRYHAEVVDSMANAIDIAAKQHCRSHDHRCKPPQLTLIGHSGGATLAVLIARRLQNVHAVITIAGNLDTEAWTAAHAYLPLTGSLNPAAAPPLPASIRQTHLIAEHDATIPAGIIESYCSRQPAPATICVMVPGTTHNGGWDNQWRALLAAYTASERQP